jgi:hypothetical protein
MPGVHSDVGGAYNKRHLGNLALLTMIDRVIAKTSLSFDLKQCKKLQVLPDGGELVRIHDEFNAAWRVMSKKKARQIDPKVPQSLHPFAKRLASMPVNFKREERQQSYSLSPEFSTLEIAEEFISGNFRSNCR